MLDYVALGIMIFVGLTIVYGVVYIHDIPYKIAKANNHPHTHAIHVAGWVSLVTLHAIWPLLWIWASLYHPEHGYNFGDKKEKADLETRIAALEAALAAHGPAPAAKPGGEG